MAVSRSPYTTGAEFVLILTDPVDNSTCHVRVKVVQAYPFTKSQALKVDILGVTHGYKSLPQTAFLKLYDRRYLDDRAADGDNPWDQGKEAKADEIHRRIQSRLPDAEFLAQNIGAPEREQEMLESIYFDEDDYKDEVESFGADPDAVNQWIIEMRYRSKTLGWFYTECQAYRRMQSLQGISIPRFYGTTLFDATCEMAAGIEPEVLGILLEFIDGMTLEDVLDTDSCLARHPYVGQAAVDCFDTITRCGVLHGDVRLANIMVSDSGRIYLIDFAFATFRPPHVTDTVWDQQVSEQQESMEAKDLLHNKGLRDRTPPEPYSDRNGNYWRYNDFVEEEKEEWRVKYYEPSDFDEALIRHKDPSGKKCVSWLPKWLPKYKVLVERKIYLNQLGVRYKQEFQHDREGMEFVQGQARPHSVGPTYIKGQRKGVHGTVRSSADEELTAKTMAGSRGEIRLAVYYLKQALFNVEVEEAEWVEEYDEWDLELTHLQRIKNSTKTQTTRCLELKELKGVEKARQERAQTENVIQAIIVGMEKWLLDH